MENSILEAINYVSRLRKQKVTIDSISSFLNSRGATNLDNASIATLLKEMQADGLINELPPLPKSKYALSLKIKKVKIMITGSMTHQYQ